MRILVIAGNYPSKENPNNGAFVYNLMQELALSHEITIISPQKRIKGTANKVSSYGDEKCNVIRPRYISFSNKKVLGFNTNNLTDYAYKRAVEKGLKESGKEFDIIYTHFLNNAISILDTVIKEKIPLVIASGESTYNSWSFVSKLKQEKLKCNFSHIICVSKENKEQLIDLGFDSNKMSVIPNAVNYDLFQPLSKELCKEKLGINKNKFVVGFIGHFIYRKGPDRIIEAIESLRDEDITLVCVGGNGNLKENSFTKSLDPVPNFRLPDIYNAFDIFVLPTLHEGSCNVIEEAKACGIPVISSKGTSVEEQIDESIGILVDPLSIEDITSSIKELKKNTELREQMIKVLKDRRGENSIENRANRISSILVRINSI